MNAKNLKHLYEKVPESIKMLFSSIICRGLTANPIFLQQYEELIRADSMSEEEINEMQFQRLKKLCIFAYENTPYYHRLFDTHDFNCYDFDNVVEFSKKIPILTKKDILENYNDINVESVRGDYPSSTGGSSGTRLVVNNSKECFYRENAFICHHFLKFNVEGKYNKIRFAYIGGDGKSLITASPLYNMMRYNCKFINRTTLPQVIQNMNKFQPKIIRGLPSALYFFCKLMDEAKIKLNYTVIGVIFQSENIYLYQRELIERVLNCKSLAYYGQTERVVFAEEHFSDDVLPQYSFNKLYGYIEFDENDDNTIIGTGFINYKMPLLRYKMDDSVEQLSNGYYHIIGHRTAAMIGKNGERFSTASFTDMDAVFDLIDKFQFIQDRPGEVRVDLVPRRGLSENEIKKIQISLEHKFAGQMSFSINFVDEVQLTKRGKYTPLIQHIKEETVMDTE